MHMTTCDMDPPSTLTRHSQNHDSGPLSPSFADSGIDMELELELPQTQTQTQTSEAPTEPDTNLGTGKTETESLHLAARLAKLAMNARKSDNGVKSRSFSKTDRAILHRCLETIENTLFLPDDDDDDNDDDDPRPTLTQEIAKHRPQSLNLTPHYPSPPSSTVAESSPSAVSHTAEPRSEPHPTESQLTVVLEEVTALGSELDKRRRETFHIYELFTQKCQGLERRIADLEGEVRELNTDILENSIEREGLRGTVYGLENWVDGWQRDHELAIIQARDARKGWMKRKPARREDDADALFDGITAWMRGWKDIEEGFQARERQREQRRDGRQKQQSLDAIRDNRLPLSSSGENS